MTPSRRTTFSDLPDEVETMILTRLPTKVIGKCKCVNRGLMLLIEDTRFTRSHLETMMDQNKYVILKVNGFGNFVLMYEAILSGNRTYSRVAPEEDPKKIYVASCGEFDVCCIRGDKLYVCNPTTKKSFPIPSENIEFPTRSDKAWVLYGMGIASRSNNYRVVRIAWFPLPNFHMEVKMWSLLSRNWIKLPRFPFDRFMPWPGVFVEGHLHWQVWDNNKGFIVALNLDTHEYKVIDVPEGSITSTRDCDIVALGEDKLVLYKFFYSKSDVANMWILEDYSNHYSWRSVKITLNNAPTDPHNSLRIRPICVLKPTNTIIICHIYPKGAFMEYDTELEMCSILNECTIPYGAIIKLVVRENMLSPLEFI